MYFSLEKHCKEFHLYIFAFNDKAFTILKKLQLQHATIIPLAEFEDETLLAIKPTRSVAEYCWTCTPSTILYALDTFNLDNCTYLDADLYFYSSPAVLFREMGKKSINITEHRYSPQYYKKDIKNGRFCVQWVTILNNPHGRTALEWWRDRCNEWCYDRHEDGKFGDQAYLNDWETRFEGVHVMQHKGGGLAPWNIQQYDFYTEGDSIIGIELERGREFEAIFFHFHYLKYFTDGTVEFGRRHFSKNVLDIFYRPYLRRLDEMNSLVNTVEPGFDAHGTRPPVKSWKTPLIFLYRKMRGVYHIYDKNSFMKV